jgi:hypothetical protein
MNHLDARQLSDLLSAWLRQGGFDIQPGDLDSVLAQIANVIPERASSLSELALSGSSPEPNLRLAISELTVAIAEQTGVRR